MLFTKLRQSLSIQPPKLDASDAGRFFADISRASDENVQEARSHWRWISESIIKPWRRAAWEKCKRLFRSRHRKRWGDDSDSYD